ncbi:[FeFe] hydrogenase, group A [Anaerorhabdus sp.]|uniref:[FeFe] hydrogenase, group A n=1 Tax=Anaerorhabdus sp. TaxID=1872524 RepID=UPI002FCB1B11
MTKHLEAGIRVPVEPNNVSLKRIEDLCIKCGKCRDVCSQMISVGGHFDINKTMDTAICINCGQCILTCPTGSLVERQDWMDVQRIIDLGNKKVVFMTSPSVRVGLGEEFGLPNGSFVEKKMVGALRKLGGNYIFDTTFAADLTIMEEASELIDRITNSKPLPQFTSCCPAWVKFVETYYPSMLNNISTSKSPISMFGPTIKTYFKEKEKLNIEDIVTVAITPCTAKKYEIKRPEMNDAGKLEGKDNIQDTDYVITTRELAKWLKALNLDLNDIEESEYDDLLPKGSGAGVIFGNTGGVMEAALRTAAYMLDGKNLPVDSIKFESVRGLNGIKEATVRIKDMDVKVAVIHGTNNAREFIKNGIDGYHFVEVMTCSGGCIAGGGQPIHLSQDMDEIRKARIESLYKDDEKSKIRYSHENVELKKLYEEYFSEPMSELAEQLLHTSYIDRSSDLNEDPSIYSEPTKNIEKENVNTSSISYVCIMCGYVYEGDITLESDDYICPICSVGKELFEKKN